MKYSLLIPTRDRAKKFVTLLESIYKTTTKKKNLEILFICDDDDKASQQYVQHGMSLYSRHMNMKLLTRPRSEMLNEDYYNWAARQATGDMIWVLADDLVLMAYNWDTRLTEYLENYFIKYPDRICCCSILDNTPPPSHRLPKFPCFPMFSKEARQALGGWILHPKVPTWGADYITYCIFKNIGRLVEFKDRNYINHVSWHNKQEKADPTNVRIGAIFNRLKMVPHHNTDRILGEEVPRIRLDLLQKIRDFNNSATNNHT